MYNYSGNPSLPPSQGITLGKQPSPMMFCLFVLIIIIVILTSGIVIIGVFLSNALNSPDCEPVVCPTSSPASSISDLTPEQVAQHLANFEQLKNDIIAAEGYYSPEFLHKREYYTRDILPPLTDEQKSAIFDPESGCTDQTTFGTEDELAQVENGQWMNNVEYDINVITVTRFVEQGRKKRSRSSLRSCGAFPPAVLYTAIVHGTGVPCSLFQPINGRIQWIFHEDCNGNNSGGCSGGQCCQITRRFKALVYLTGEGKSLMKDIEVHTCDCALST